MNFRYEDYSGRSRAPGMSVCYMMPMTGDATLFQRQIRWKSPGCGAADSGCMEVCDAAKFPNYAAGSWGPQESEDL